MDPIIIEALLVRGEGEHVRVILEPYCLDFQADDVLDLEEVPLPPGITEGESDRRPGDAQARRPPDAVWVPPHPIGMCYGTAISPSPWPRAPTRSSNSTPR